LPVRLKLAHFKQEKTRESKREKKMTKKNVKIGNIYRAKVSENSVKVKILSACSDGGWRARNLSTGREIHVKTAARLLLILQ